MTTWGNTVANCYLLTVSKLSHVSYRSGFNKRSPFVTGNVWGAPSLDTFWWDVAEMFHVPIKNTLMHSHVIITSCRCISAECKATLSRKPKSPHSSQYICDFWNKKMWYTVSHCDFGIMECHLFFFYKWEFGFNILKDGKDTSILIVRQILSDQCLICQNLTLRWNFFQEVVFPSVWVACQCCGS